MTKTTATALNIARLYVEAIVNKDIDTIVSISNEDVVCTSPIGQITGSERFRHFHAGFAQMTTKLTVLAVYGDEQQAVVVYDAEMQPVPHSLVAELIRIRDGKIASTDVVYDATPFAAYMATAQPH
ncbi:nuclear transport factor 2 family protein [Pectobacterium jejuense]|uniref:nuclear transport factor 2 family protein n=1 Tax=Pectobacterium jejuense TaxID=2974022 RepID=UPI00380FC667